MRCHEITEWQFHAAATDGWGGQAVVRVGVERPHAELPGRDVTGHAHALEVEVG